jgi:tRNA (adenine22-N1)-methyltransferase
MITLSKRLEAIAELITPGNVVADVGTDHGYIPIRLVQQEKCPRAIAMDLREGPLARASEHIRRCGLSERIETRLSDGTKALRAGEADTIVCAGMGGDLILHILTDGEEVCRSARELILQPQSEIARVRRYLREHEYSITAENMILEDGKYYPMMRVLPLSETGMDNEATEYREVYDLYGRLLLQEKHPILRQYLEREEKQLTDILGELDRQSASEKLKNRRAEIEKKLELNRRAWKLYFEEE